MKIAYLHTVDVVCFQVKKNETGQILEELLGSLY